MSDPMEIDLKWVAQAERIRQLEAENQMLKEKLDGEELTDGLDQLRSKSDLLPLIKHLGSRNQELESVVKQYRKACDSLRYNKYDEVHVLVGMKHIERLRESRKEGQP